MRNEIMGFSLVSSKEIKEQGGTLHEYKHKDCSARLFYFETEATNKLFSVTFKTVPTDDTGVFHILEHSCLCGSAKYPVKEPFVELLKSSMNTYLNALTFYEKTSYPVSSRNDKDFFNLMQVYLDAVFAPALLENPNIFYQEGWHYEPGQEENEGFVINGVVYNEMRGHESDIAGIMDNAMDQLLFPDNGYRFVHGGTPEAIPTLTYDKYIETYKRCYNPGNAIFYLEGKLDFAKAVEYISEYMKPDVLAGLETTDWAKYDYQQPRPAAITRKTYSIARDEDPAERGQVMYGKILFDLKEKEKFYALQLLGQYLASDNESPLVAAILDNNLGSNLCFDIMDLAQRYMLIKVENCHIEDEPKIRKAIWDAVDKIKREGINKEELRTYFSQMEFSYREVMEPKAFSHNMQLLQTAVYGEDPALFLTFEDTFDFLRQQLDTDYFDKLLADFFEESTVQTLIMEAVHEEPSEEKVVYNGDMEELKRLNQELLDWQQSEDSPENLAKMPSLQLSDVERLPEKINYTEQKINNTVVRKYSCPTNGIVYCSMYFPVPEELLRKPESASVLGFLPVILGDLDTDNYKINELNNEIRKYTGSLYFDVFANSKMAELDSCRVYVQASFSALRQNVENAAKLMEEIMYRTVFDNPSSIKQYLVQVVEEIHDGLLSEGHKFAMGHGRAATASDISCIEYMTGYQSYLYLDELLKNYEDRAEGFIEELKHITDSVFSKDGALVSLVCDQEVDETQVLKVLRDFEKKSDSTVAFPLLQDYKEKITVPVLVSHFAGGYNLYGLGEKMHGKWKVLAQMCSLSFLWNEVRVKGGAYGCFMGASDFGNIYVSSYRDPSPENTMEICKSMADYVEEMVSTMSQEELDSYIISSVGALDPLVTGAVMAGRDDVYFLRGMNYEQRAQLRREMLETSRQDLMECVPVLRRFADEMKCCIVGN